MLNLLYFKKDLLFNFYLYADILILKRSKFLFLKFFGPLNFQYFYISFDKLHLINTTNFFIRNLILKCLLLSFRSILFGVCCGYLSRFDVIGYNYRVKTSFLFSYLLVFLGHFFSVLLKFPSTIKVFKKKRSFIIFGTNLLDFNFTVFFLRHLRDLYPYKTRGLAVKNEFVFLKRGKKLKLR